MTNSGALFQPPFPKRLPPVAALARTLWRGDGDLLSLLPREAYTMKAGELGYSRRSIKVVNDAALIRDVMIDADAMFPKSDLMVDALDPLIGDSIFVSDGERWRRQRAMIDPAFSLMRLSVAFQSMADAVADYAARLDERATSGEAFSLDLAMSHLTADIICRTVFSMALTTDIAQDVFDDFAFFERNVGQVKIARLITSPAFKPIAQAPQVLEACARIRGHLGAIIDTHLNEPGRYNDIATHVIAARDQETGEAFSRDELIDQLGVFFLAGHDTTASALISTLYVLAMRPDILGAVREEVDAAVGERDMTFEDVKRLPLCRSVFRETLRLYPPITFMPRVAMRAGRLGDMAFRRGALIMIAPWIVHRHTAYWDNPDAFDPERFLPHREAEVEAGAYIPFGLGPHSCIGAGFALAEAALIIATIAGRFDLHIENGDRVVPTARLTTRPREQVFLRVSHRKAGV